MTSFYFSLRFYLCRLYLLLKKDKSTLKTKELSIGNKQAIFNLRKINQRYHPVPILLDRTVCLLNPSVLYVNTMFQDFARSKLSPLHFSCCIDSTR